MVYCGQTIPNSFFSNNSNVTIQFFSDATISSPGFRLVWDTTPGTVRLKFTLDIFIIFNYLYCTVISRLSLQLESEQRVRT